MMPKAAFPSTPTLSQSATVEEDLNALLSLAGISDDKSKPGTPSNQPPSKLQWLVSGFMKFKRNLSTECNQKRALKISMYSIYLV